MRRTTIVGAALAVLVLTAGTAAATPADAPTDDRAAGPPSELPGPVPDFVTGTLDAVGSFLSGDLDGALGPVVSDIAGNGGS